MKELHNNYNNFINNPNFEKTKSTSTELTLLRMIFFKSGILNVMHNTIDLCFTYFKFTQKSVLNLVSLVSNFLTLVFDNDPFSISILLKRGVFDIINKNITYQSFYYETDYDICSIYKLFVLEEISFIEKMIESIRDNNYRLSYHSFLHPLIHLTVNKYSINKFSLRNEKEKGSHSFPIFNCNGEKRLKHKKINNEKFVVDISYLISTLFDNLQAYYPLYEFKVEKFNKDQAEKKKIKYEEEDKEEKLKVKLKYVPHSRLSISIYKLIKEIAIANCLYDAGDILNECVVFFSSFIEKYLLDEFEHIQDLTYLIQREQHQVAELTVIMISVLNQLPEDSTAPILNLINIPIMQKLLYWLEEDYKNFKYIRNVNEAILRKLMISLNQISVNSNFSLYKTDEQIIENKKNNEITVYSVSFKKKNVESIQKDKILEVKSNFERRKSLSTPKNKTPKNIQENQKELENDKNTKFIYLEEKNIESYLYGEYVRNLINDFSYYLTFEEENKNYINNETNRIKKLAGDSYVPSNNQYEIKSNVIFVEQKQSCKYFIEVIWSSIIEILKSIICNSPTITPLLIGYFNTNLYYFLKGLSYFLNHVSCIANQSKQDKELKYAFINILFSPNLAESIIKSSEKKINDFIRKITDNVNFHADNIFKLKNSGIDKSIVVFRYYLEILRSKYIYSDVFKINENCEKEETINAYHKNYIENYEFFKDVQKEIITDFKNEKYLINTRKYLVDILYEFLIGTSKVLKFNNKIDNNEKDNCCKINTCNFSKLRYLGKLFGNIHYDKSDEVQEVDFLKNETLKGSNILRTFNYIFKIDPDPIQKYLVKEKPDWLKNMITIVIHNLKQLMKKNFISCSIDMSHKNNLVSSFYDQLEFLRLLCENHNKLFQFIIMKYDPDFLPELLSFTHKIYVSLNSYQLNYSYLNVNNSKEEISIIQRINDTLKEKSIDEKIKLKIEKQLYVKKTSRLRENFTNSDTLFEIVFNFLIEVVQGATPSTFKFIFENENNSKCFKSFFTEFSRIREKIIDICEDSKFTGKDDFKKSDEPSKNKSEDSKTTDKFARKMTTIKFFNHFIRFTSQCLDEPNNKTKYKNEILSNFNEDEYLKLQRIIYKKIVEVNNENTNKFQLNNKNMDEETDDEIKENEDETNDKELKIFKEKYNSNNITEDFEKLSKLQECHFFKMFINLSLFIKNNINIKQLQGELNLRDKITLLNKIEDKKNIYLFDECYKFNEAIICRVEIKFQDSFVSFDDYETYINLINLFEKNYIITSEEVNEDKLKVEVTTQKESVIKEIFFYKSPDCFYLIDEDTKNINFCSSLHIHKQRLVDFIEKIEDIKKEVSLRKKIKSDLKNVYFTTLNSINYKYLIIFSTILAAIINILLIVYSISPYRAIDPAQIALHPSIYEPDTRISYINEQSYWILLLGIIQFVFLSISISCWGFVTTQICMLDDEIENDYSSYKDDIEDKKSYYYYRIAKRVLNKLLIETEVLLLVWNLWFGILAFTYPIFYSIQLLSLIFIADVMKTVLYSFLVGDRYKQFFAMGIMISITIIIYSFFAFYFFKDRFDDLDLGINTCQFPMMCFITLLNQGLRTGEGPSFNIKTISDPSYFSELIFTWTFYFALILIMISIINGIIVDAFQELRSKKNIQEKIIENNCFICDLDSTTLEVNGEKFDEHINNSHSINTYLNYLIHIITTPDSELNSIEFYVNNCIKISDTSFFPNKDYFKIK